MNEPAGITRRGFVGSATCALAAYALGGLGLFSGRAKAAAPVWDRIPDQHWAVGEPVFLDLAEFVTDPDGDALTFTLGDTQLPPGVTFDGRVISGTPTAEFATTVVDVTADDGTPEESRPKAPTGLNVSTD